MALALGADGFPAQVISADSRQVYRGTDVATAKPTLAERRGVPHHGLDLVDPDERFSVADFVGHVETVLPAIAGRGGVALLVGGTGFWLRAIADGLAIDALPWDPAVRASLEADLLEHGLGALVARLQATAPALAARIDLRNPRRVVRALEIATIQGDAPLPARQPSWTGASSRRPVPSARAIRPRCPPSPRSGTGRRGTSSTG